MAHTRQSRPDSSLDFQVNALSTFQAVAFSLGSGTGVPRSQKNVPPQDPTVALRLGPYGGPKGWAVSHERGTPVGVHKRLVTCASTAEHQ
jgi:hypothetical protein